MQKIPRATKNQVIAKVGSALLLSSAFRCASVNLRRAGASTLFTAQRSVLTVARPQAAIVLHQNHRHLREGL